MQQRNQPNIIPAGTVMNATINSAPMQLQNALGYAIQIFFAGTPTGVWTLQASCDNPATNTASGGKAANSAPTNWTTVANSSQAVSAAGDITWDTSQFSFYTFVRAVYTDTSSGASTATITSATFNSKGG
jgi:hypothetical protein